jgi:hypothetical protein
MLKPKDIEREALKIARKNFGSANVLEAIVEPMIDLDGDDAWRVRIVIDSKLVDNIDGDAVLDNLVQIHNRLWEEGEERLPFVEFTTREELAESDDPEL